MDLTSPASLNIRLKKYLLDKNKYRKSTSKNEVLFSWCTRREFALEFCEAGSKRGVCVLQNCAEILSLRCHGHKVSFWSEAIESRGNSFQNDKRRKSSVIVQKQRTVLFFHCVRFPSSYYWAKLKERDKTLSFNFGGLDA